MDTERANSDSHTKEKLLSLRKEYKKTSVSLAKAKAHHSFMSSCKDKLQTPRGLQINVHCSAFLTDLSNIKEQFTETTNQAEQSYVSHLDDHYSAITQQLVQKLSLLKNTMATLQSQATKEEYEQHQTLIEKTDNNAQKFSSELNMKKKRKLDIISNPHSKKKKENHQRVSNPTRTPIQRYCHYQRGSNPTRTPIRMPLTNETQPLTPIFQTPLLSMTLGDLFAGLQRQGSSPFQPQPQIVTTHCTPDSVQPPQLIHPGGKVSLRQPPQLPQTLQQYGVLPQQQIYQDFVRPGRLSSQQPH